MALSEDRITQIQWIVSIFPIQWPLKKGIQVYQVYTMFRPICLLDVPRASPPSPSTRRFFAAGPLDFGMTSNRKPVVMGYGSLWVCPTIYTPKKPWFIRKLIIIQNHSSSLPIIFPSKLTFWSPRFLDHPYMCPRLVDAGTIFPSNFQLSVEVFPTVLHVMQEEVLCVFTGVGHVLRTGKLAGLVTGTVFEYVKMMDE